MQRRLLMGRFHDQAPNTLIDDRYSLDVKTNGTAVVGKRRDHIVEM